MTGKELKALIPDDARVLIQGYEYGFQDIEPEKVKFENCVIQADSQPCYGGPHQAEGDDVPDMSYYNDFATMERCLVIRR